MYRRESEILRELELRGNLRQLRTVRSGGAYLEFNGEKYLNFSSNDYLGISSGINSDPLSDEYSSITSGYNLSISPDRDLSQLFGNPDLTSDKHSNTHCNESFGISSNNLQQDFLSKIDFTSGEYLMGSSGSRLVTGNSPEYDNLERLLSAKLGKESALVLGSGFLLNTGILPAITTSEDTIISDKQVHASIIEGIRLSPAQHERFRHNDMNHLENLLRKSAGKGRTIVVTESLFSMDGDRAPLRAIASLQQQYDFDLYLDEAHAFGVWGIDGFGLATEVPELRVDYLIATFGKAIASQGAFVACDSLRRELLVNRMRTLIYSTALPPISLRWTKYVVERLSTFADRRTKLTELIGIMGGDSQIRPYVVGSNEGVLRKSEELLRAGYWVSAMRSPTVQAGSERLRISLTAAHTKHQIEELCKLLG